METEQIELSAREREQLKVLQQVDDGPLRQIEAARRLRLALVTHGVCRCGCAPMEVGGSCLGCRPPFGSEDIRCFPAACGARVAANALRILSVRGFTCLTQELQVGWLRSEIRMVITNRKAGSITILDLNGALKLGESEREFRQRVQQLIDDGSKQLAINLAGVPEMDSSGVGSLVRALTLVKKSGGHCTFFAPTKRVLQLLKMVRLDTILDIAEDEATALSRT